MYWSIADEKAPVKASGFIHFSRTSQPPRFTPRRKGTVVFVDEVAVEDGVVDAVGVAGASEVRDGKLDERNLLNSAAGVAENVTNVLAGLS